MTALRDSLSFILDSLGNVVKEVKAVQKMVDNFEKALAVVGSESKAPRKVRKAQAKARKGSSTETVLNIIAKSEEAVSTEDIIEKTGLDKKTVYGILNRAKKTAKIKSPKRGFYQKG